MTKIEVFDRDIAHKIDTLIYVLHNKLSERIFFEIDTHRNFHVKIPKYIAIGADLTVLDIQPQ